MNVEFVNPFLISMVKVLSTMAQTEAIPGKPSLKTTDSAKGDVTGIIGLAGQQTKGSLAISFTENAIFHIATQMLGEKIDKLDETIADMVGEITNMVTGGAKRILSEKGYKFELSIPSMIVGKNHIIAHKTNGPVIVVPFNTNIGDFFIEVGFER
ncbi:MAG: chemotaxis protein CheX [Nitrospirae bacterium]|nr:chemotaxis protein CheX [Nitrospirota bacterium]